MGRAFIYMLLGGHPRGGKPFRHGPVALRQNIALGNTEIGCRQAAHIVQQDERRACAAGCIAEPEPARGGRPEAPL